MSTPEFLRLLATLLAIVVIPGLVAVGIMALGTGLGPSTARKSGSR